MIFVWNILLNALQLLPPDLNVEPTDSWLNALLAPVITLWNQFTAYRIVTLKRMRYNCQTEIFQSLLNDMFDPTHRRITINTTADTNDEVYIGQQITNGTENDQVYIGQQITNSNESDEVYIGLDSDYPVHGDFIVTAATGSLTPAQIIQLKAIVNYYRYDSLIPYYQYSDGTPF